jgi:four helix bundle protein
MVWCVALQKLPDSRIVNRRRTATRNMTTFQNTEQSIAISEWLGVCTRRRNMAGFRSHRDFAAWQLAYGLRHELMPLLQRILRAKDYPLHKNMREAARSATRNIAEGFGRYKHKDFARFVRIAKASEVEMLDHLLEAHVCGYLDDTDFAALEHLTHKAIKAANGLIRYLESTPDRPDEPAEPSEAP